MKPEIQQLILRKIAIIEQELQGLKQLIETTADTNLVIDDNIIDAEIVEELSPKEQSPIQLLQTLFSIVSDHHSTDTLRKAVVPLLHSSISEHSPAVDSFFRFSFKTFQDRWKEYLDSKQNPRSFQIERQKENHLGELMELKLYLLSINRSPSPITFKQDPKHHMQWRIQSLSL